MAENCRSQLVTDDKTIHNNKLVMWSHHYSLFHTIRYSPDHVLRPLLPEQNNYSYNLRNRTHNFHLSSQHDSRNFIDRVLYSNYSVSQSFFLTVTVLFSFSFTYLLLFYYHINSCVLMRSVIIVIKNVCMYVCMVYQYNFRTLCIRI